MKLFRTEDTVSFNLGTILELSEEQASVRMMGKNLHHIKGRRYEVVKPVEFKKGEIIGIEGEIPKLLIQKFKEIEKEKESK